MPRLDFVVIGPQRCGTSWLHAALKHHSALALPATMKETFFLDQSFQRGWDWYWSQFDGPADAVHGEVAPSYFSSHLAADRLQHHNPSARILTILRHPAERAFSLYLHHLKRGRVKGDLLTASRQLPEILATGDYRRHCEAWRERFGRNLNVIMYEDIALRPETVFGAALDIAGVPQIPAPDNLHARVYETSLPAFPRVATLATRTSEWLRRHGGHGILRMGRRFGLQRVYTGRRSGEPHLSIADRIWLLDRYAADIDYAEGLIGQPLDHWRR